MRPVRWCCCRTRTAAAGTERWSRKGRRWSGRACGATALTDVNALPLDGYQPWHVARADLLDRLGRTGDGRRAYDEALALTTNAVERAHLERRRQALEST